jgi:hypothetical protein
MIEDSTPKHPRLVISLIMVPSKKKKTRHKPACFLFKKKSDYFLAGNRWIYVNGFFFVGLFNVESGRIRNKGT